jgi:hypothetical protein
MMSQHTIPPFRLLSTIAISILLAVTAAPAASAQSKPAVTLQSILNTDVYDSGFMGLDYTDVAFAPKNYSEAKVKVVDAAGRQLAEFGFFSGYKVTQSVFARLQPENMSEYTFKTGDYALEYSLNGETITRLPFSVVEKSTSDDPFNPGSTVKFVGPWQDWAYLTFASSNEAEPVSVTFWAGASDLAPGKIRGPFTVYLTRNGKIVAHSKRAAGMLGHEWLRDYRLQLFYPHDQKGSPNALFFDKNEISKAGDYRLSVKLEETGEVIRTYAFRAAKGKLTPHKRTVLSYKPHTDYIPPRVTKRGASSYEFEEAFWIKRPGK